MTEHRWSGWPGAWCLDCGIEDVVELCIVEHVQPCDCSNGDCLEPGSRRHDPYLERE